MQYKLFPIVLLNYIVSSFVLSTATDFVTSYASMKTGMEDSQYQCDLWIAGAGRLSTTIITEWLKQKPHAKIIAETNSDSRHEELRRLGAIPRLRHRRSEVDYGSAKNVLISFPPYSRRHTDESNNIYHHEVEDACKLWCGDKTLHNDHTDSNSDDIDGNLVLVSSSAVYGTLHDKTGMPCNEHSVVDYNNPRAANLLQAENIVLKCKGSVIRLAGLYSSDIGPGHYWFNQITIKSQHSNGNGVIHTLRDDNEATGVLGVSPYDRINMIEYTDAAVACFKLLQYQKSQDDTSPNVYLAADGYPLSRLNILHNTVTKYSELSETNIETLKKYFTPSDGLVVSGKILDCSLTRRLLQWQPRYKGYLNDYELDKSESSCNL